MCSNYPGIKLEPALGTLEDKTEHLSSYAHLVHTIDHFTVSCSVVWPLNESEAGGDLVLIETSLLFLC